jgi:Transposase, Mutator family
VEFVVSDDHAGLRRAIQEALPEAVWQCCYVHFLRNALDYLPRYGNSGLRHRAAPASLWHHLPKRKTSSQSSRPKPEP